MWVVGITPSHYVEHGGDFYIFFLICYVMGASIGLREVACHTGMSMVV